MKGVAVVTIAFLLPFATGCAATGPTYDDIAATLAAPTDGKARVFFYCLDGWWNPVPVQINGEVVGAAVDSGFFFVDLDSGRCEIAAHAPHVVLDPRGKTQVTLEEGERYFVEIVKYVGHASMPLRGNASKARAILVNPQHGIRSIANTRYRPAGFRR